MNKLHQITTIPAQISPLTTVEQSQIKGGAVSASCDEKRKKINLG
jgi:hypothetical protein